MKVRVIFFCCCLLLLCYNCFSQITVTNKGITITNNNQEIYVNGSVINETNGFIRNTGSIFINGNITNNATTSFSDSASGNFYLNGSQQTIGGSNNLTFHRFLLNITDTLELQQSIKITDSLDFINGFIHLNGNTINLDSTGKLTNERHASHIYGAAGKITTQKSINQPTMSNNLGGMGLKFQSSNTHGMVTIERSHYQQPAADTSILRFYKIITEFPNLIDSMSVSYVDAERFNNETNYKIFTKKISGTNGWKNKGGAVDYTDKKVSTNSQIVLDSLLVTIADEMCAFPPDINVPGISTLVPLMTIDTITCADDTLSINAYSSAPNALINWRDPSDSIYSNPFQVSKPDLYFIDVENGLNGCTNSILVGITQFKTPPLLTIDQDSVFLNCSQTSLQINGSSPTPQTTLIWTGRNNFNTPNPAAVTDTGIYYLTAIRADNGCTAIDSTYLGFKPYLIVTAGNDTLVCKNSNVILSASVSGSVSGVNYIWNNGAVTSSTTVNPAATTTYVITAASSGCSGKDTVVVTIPPPITDSISTYQACDGTKSGTIVIYANGGIPPYLYSIDNGVNFLPAGNFTNIPYGNYTVLIKDSLDCTKSNTAAINGFSKMPAPQFIASSRNTKGDTIVLVDISVPEPDSVSWILPIQASIIGGNMFNPMIYMPDTGSYYITMIGYFADCVLDTTKLIHFFNIDTSFASQYNNNGIKSLTLYPNPNNGIFTVTVEFYKKQNSSIQIWDMTPTKYFQKNFTDTNIITLPINLSQLINGTYMLRVIGEYNARHLNFIINH